jgi:hypothetical protein
VADDRTWLDVPMRRRIALGPARSHCRSETRSVRRGCLGALGAGVLAVHFRDAECQVE